MTNSIGTVLSQSLHYHTYEQFLLKPWCSKVRSGVSTLAISCVGPGLASIPEGAAANGVDRYENHERNDQNYPHLSPIFLYVL